MTSVQTPQEALVDALLKDSPDPRALRGEHGLLQPLTKRGGERGLEAALSAHRGLCPHVRHGREEPKARNGQGQQTVQTDTGPVDLVVPRDRNGRVAPQRVPKRQRRLEGCAAPGWRRDARGLATRARQGHRAALDGPAVAPPRSSTSPVAVRAWPARPLASGSPLLDWAALFVPARQEGPGQPHAVSLALGLTMDGAPARLGLWLRESEGATLGLAVLPTLPHRGGQDCWMAWVEGLPGLPAALAAVWPQPPGPLCRVPQGRNSLPEGPWQARRAGAAALRALAGAAPRPDAEPARARVAEPWEAPAPALSLSGRAAWDPVPVCLDSPLALRRARSTTNASASWPAARRQGLPGRRAFPQDESILPVLAMGLQHVATKWTPPMPEGQAALKQLVMRGGERGQV